MDHYDRWKQRKRREREAYRASRESSKQNYYDILGVSRDATTEEIERTWRDIVEKASTANGEMISMLRLGHEAYRVLIDPMLRSVYDNDLEIHAVEVPIGSHYELLGVDIAATEIEIKKAWKRVAKQWHPDVCRRSDAVKIFRNMNDAYLVLSCSDQRRMYDLQIGVAS